MTAVETLNNALVANVTSHYTLDHVTPTDSLYEITPYLGACGLTQPLLQVYSTFKVIIGAGSLLSISLFQNAKQKFLYLYIFFEKRALNYTLQHIFSPFSLG